MTCDKIRELLLAELDNETSPREELMIRTHLSGCSACSDEREGLIETRDTLGRVFTKAPSRLRRVRARFVAAAVVLIGLTALISIDRTEPVQATDVLVDAPTLYAPGAPAGMHGYLGQP